MNVHTHLVSCLSLRLCIICSTMAPHGLGAARRVRGHRPELADGDGVGVVEAARADLRVERDVTLGEECRLELQLLLRTAPQTAKRQQQESMHDGIVH